MRNRRKIRRNKFLILGAKELKPNVSPIENKAYAEHIIRPSSETGLTNLLHSPGCPLWSWWTLPRPPRQRDAWASRDTLLSSDSRSRNGSWKEMQVMQVSSKVIEIDDYGFSIYMPMRERETGSVTWAWKITFLISIWNFVDNGTREHAFTTPRICVELLDSRAICD